VSGTSVRERCFDIPEGCRQQQRALREGRAQSSTTVLRVSLVTWIILHGKVIDIYDLRSHFAHRRRSTQATGACRQTVMQRLVVCQLRSRGQEGRQTPRLRLDQGGTTLVLLGQVMRRRLIAGGLARPFQSYCTIFVASFST